MENIRNALYNSNELSVEILVSLLKIYLPGPISSKFFNELQDLLILELKVDVRVKMICAIFEHLICSLQHFDKDEFPLITDYLFRLVFKLISGLLDILESMESLGKMFSSSIEKFVLLLENIRKKNAVFIVSLLRSIFEHIFKLSTSNRVYFMARRKLLLFLNDEINNCDPNVLNKNLKLYEHSLKKLFEWILYCGDYQLQEAITYIVMYHVSVSTHSLSRLSDWVSDYPEVKDATSLLSLYHLKSSTRKFLNQINGMNLTSCRVFSLCCISITGGDNIELLPPKETRYQKFWIDFSSRTQIIHTVIDSGSDWNDIIVKPKSVKEIICSRKKSINGTNKEVINLQIELILPISIVSRGKQLKLQSLNISFKSGEIFNELKNKFLSVHYPVLMERNAKGSLGKVASFSDEPLNSLISPLNQTFNTSQAINDKRNSGERNVETSLKSQNEVNTRILEIKKKNDSDSSGGRSKLFWELLNSHSSKKKQFIQSTEVNFNLEPNEKKRNKKDTCTNPFDVSVSTLSNKSKSQLDFFNKNSSVAHTVSSLNELCYSGPDGKLDLDSPEKVSSDLLHIQESKHLDSGISHSNSSSNSVLMPSQDKNNVTSTICLTNLCPKNINKTCQDQISVKHVNFKTNHSDKSSLNSIIKVSPAKQSQKISLLEQNSPFNENFNFNDSIVTLSTLNKSNPLEDDISLSDASSNFVDRFACYHVKKPVPQIMISPSGSVNSLTKNISNSERITLSQQIKDNKKSMKSSDMLNSEIKYTNKLDKRLDKLNEEGTFKVTKETINDEKVCHKNETDKSKGEKESKLLSPDISKKFLNNDKSQQIVHNKATGKRNIPSFFDKYEKETCVSEDSIPVFKPGKSFKTYSKKTNKKTKNWANKYLKEHKRSQKSEQSFDFGKLCTPLSVKKKRLFDPQSNLNMSIIPATLTSGDSPTLPFLKDNNNNSNEAYELFVKSPTFCPNDLNPPISKNKLQWEKTTCPDGAIGTKTDSPPKLRRSARKKKKICYQENSDEFLETGHFKINKSMVSESSCKVVLEKISDKFTSSKNLERDVTKIKNLSDKNICLKKRKESNSDFCITTRDEGSTIKPIGHNKKVVLKKEKSMLKENKFTFGGISSFDIRDKSNMDSCDISHERDKIIPFNLQVPLDLSKRNEKEHQRSEEIQKDMNVDRDKNCFNLSLTQNRKRSNFYIKKEDIRTRKYLSSGKETNLNSYTIERKSNHNKRGNSRIFNFKNHYKGDSVVLPEDVDVNENYAYDSHQKEISTKISEQNLAFVESNNEVAKSGDGLEEIAGSKFCIENQEVIEKTSNPCEMEKESLGVPNTLEHNCMNCKERDTLIEKINATVHNQILKAQVDFDEAFSELKSKLIKKIELKREQLHKSYQQLQSLLSQNSNNFNQNEENKFQK